LFLTLLEAKKPNIKVPAPSKGLFLFHSMKKGEGEESKEQREAGGRRTVKLTLLSEAYYQDN
jgi:hypothetical protein